MKKLFYIMALPLLVMACGKAPRHAADAAAVPGNTSGWEIQYYEPTEEEIEEAGYGTWVTEVHPFLALQAAGTFAAEGAEPLSVSGVFAIDESGFWSVTLSRADSAELVDDVYYNLEVTDAQGEVYTDAYSRSAYGDQIILSLEREQILQVLNREGISTLKLSNEAGMYTFLLDLSGSAAALDEFDQAIAEAAEMNGF